jgi:soluble lytic murein transglycosylase
VLVCALPVGSGAAQPLSAEDDHLYRLAFDSARKGHFDWALDATNKAHDKLLAKVLRWQYYTAPGSGASFAEISGFIAANPDWPQPAALERRAEEAISVATPDANVLAWFDSHPPQTVDGALAYGKALIAAGRTEEATALVRRTWVTGNFGPVQEEEFLSAFEDMLRDEDDVARLQRLLWDHQDAAARQQCVRVPGDYRTLAQARIALANLASNAESLAAHVPEERAGDAGLLYERVRFLREKEQDDKAIGWLKLQPANVEHPELWWVERAILARRALQKGQITDAYSLASAHGLTDGQNFADAEWLAGWIALRFLDNKEEALGHFSNMYDHVATPQSRSRVAYWAGRAAQALGRGDDQDRWFTAAAQYPTTFYGQLAANRIDPSTHWALPADPVPTADDVKAFDKNELVRAARDMGQIKEKDLIRPFMLRVAERAATPGQRALAANLAESLGREDIAVTVAKRSERDGVPLVTSGYPVPSLNATAKPERALVLGVIRQESAFQDQVVSTAGARGLMQLMPETAAKLAKTLKIVFRRKDHLSDALTANPSLNVKLGSAYLNDLLSDFGGSYILTVAAYNAGPSRVRKWMRDLGDPRNNEDEAIDWIESIPYAETRNYVQRVLEGVQVYRHRLGAGSVALTLDKDLKRGE